MDRIIWIRCFIGEYWDNINEIKIVDADCKDELCIKQGSISKVGKTLICLPNELIIEIKGDEYDSSDDLILSH